MTVVQAGVPTQGGIGRLIELLRGDGFPVSTSEAVDATQLLLILAEKEPEALADAARLCTRLRPIFCKTREQQERFDALFRKWHRPADTAETRGPEPETTTPPEKPKWPVWMLLGILVVSGVIAAVIWRRTATVPQSDPDPILGLDAAPKTIAEPPRVEPDVPPPMEGAPVHGYFPRLRYNDELRPVWFWALAILPLVSLAGFSIPALVIARTRSRRRSEPMYLDRHTLEEEARRIVPPLRPDIAGKLARHLRGSPAGDFRLTRRPILDLRATIESTLRNRGIPTPRYRHTHAPPSYLLLIDQANQKDPRGRLFYQWAERLQRERLDVEIALVRLHADQPQFVRTTRGESPPDDRGWTSLARLPEPPFGQRLLLVSTGEPLVQADGRWRGEAVAARLHRWRQRAMFTPAEPRDWGPREDAIERSEHIADPGFLVLPLDENALSAWTDLLTTGQLTDVVLSEPQRFPKLLRRGRAKDFLQDEDPPQDVEKLIGQLRVYLGDLGFTWLAVLAIPPLIRWELTVLLGRDVVQRLTALERRDVDSVLSRNYRRLVRLPWLRFEKMPDWLRLRLLAELPAATQNELRKVVENLLGQLSPSPSADGIALDFERPPTGQAVGPSHSAADDSDPLYLGYMSGLTPRQLAMRVPEAWGKWLGKMELPRERGLRGFFASAADRARAWWARRVFLGGVPFSRPRRGPLAWAAGSLLLCASFLALVATLDPRWWPEAIEPWLFEEQAHAVAFQHAGAVRTASFSADGQRVVTASDDGTARVWDVRTGRPMTPPIRHEGPVTAAQLDPAGTLLLTASGNQARLWDVGTRRLRGSWVMPAAPIRQMEFHPSGSRIVLVAGTEARVIELSSRRAFTLVHAAAIDQAAFSRSGLVVTASRDRTARVWSPTGRLLATLVHESEVLCAAFSRDETMVATGSRAGAASVWSLAGPRLYDRLRTTSAIVQTGFDQTGKRVLTAGQDGTARIWSLGQDEPPLVLEHAGPIVSTSFSSDDMRVVTASADGTARVWNALNGRPTGPRLRHRRALTAAVFSPDGARIVTSSLDGTARIWEAEADPPETPPLRHGSSVLAVSFDPSGKRVLTASWDNTASVWDADSGARLAPPLRHASRVWWAAFDGDGRTVVTASGDNTATIWDWRSARPAVPALRHNQWVYYATFSPDGRRVLTASEDSSARVWDAGTGRPVGQPMRHQQGIWRARFAPDGRHVATASYDNTARIWDSATGKAVGNPLPHDERVSHAAFSPDGRVVVTTSDDGTARVWDARRATPVSAPLVHEGPVNHVAFDLQNRFFATSSDDGTARIFDLRGALVHKLRHQGRVAYSDFSPDGTRLVTASEDHTARIWAVETGEALGPPAWHMERVIRAAFSPDGRRFVTGMGSDPFDKMLAERKTLPNGYLVPLKSAQIWHAPPYPTPKISQAAVLRDRVERALENCAVWPTMALGAGALAAYFTAVAMGVAWRRKQIERLAAANVKEQPR